MQPEWNIPSTIPFKNVRHALGYLHDSTVKYYSKVALTLTSEMASYSYHDYHLSRHTEDISAGVKIILILNPMPMRTDYAVQFLYAICLICACAGNSMAGFTKGI